MHGAPSKGEGVLPGSGIGGACPANPDYSTRGSDVVVVAEIGIMDVERGAAGGALADSALLQQSVRGGVNFDKNGGSAIIGADDEGCSIGDIDKRRGDDTVAGSASTNGKRRQHACRSIDLV